MRWEYYDLDDTRKAVQEASSHFIVLSYYLSRRKKESLNVSSLPKVFTKRPLKGHNQRQGF